MPLLTLSDPQAHSLSVRAKALVFEDARSVDVLARLRQIAPSEATVLVMGETGTGKEIVARHIHELSQRRERAFVAVNCGALADTLIESELFGHEKGAFTGAVSSKPGWFEAASGGTLFLDEIGDLPLGMQVKLLRVLQEGEVVRVGARQPIRVDVRLVAATNVSLQQAVAAGHFREDLFYRLNVAPIVLPPLRERPGDILPLVEYFMAFYQQRLGLAAPTLSAEAVQRLLQHAWPGNIRELENAVHHALLVCQGGYVTPKDLQLSTMPARASRPPEPAASEPVTPQAALGAGLERLFDAELPDLWEAIERTVMSKAFEYCERNQLQTARLLGISRNIVRARLLEYGQIPGSVRGAIAEPLTSPPESQRVLRPSAPCVRIGFQRIGLLPLVKEHGGLDAVLSARGFRVEWIEYPGGIQMVEAFQGSQLSFAGVGEGPPVFAQAARVPIVYIAAEAPAPTDEALVVPLGSPVRSVRELAGKRIALNRGANVHYLLIRALEEAGLQYEDVEVVYLTPAEARLAFEQGHVDAWAIWAPLLHELLATGGGRVLRDASGLTDNTVLYIGSETLVQAQPELVGLFFGQLTAVAATCAPHRFPRRVDDSLLAEQQAVADTFHRYNLLGRAVRIRDSRSAATTKSAVGTASP
ncbi:MAG: sigma-54-dependent transcriptional regulator [Polyangiaceae bacterium]|jgi:sigma-54-specific transcriptional regulator|nr:sigma-54-dependent transcriptional regulator [Polyangiaceae bacterium]